MRLLRVFTLLPLLSGFSLPAYAVDPTGIPECDTFLGQYEACGLEILKAGEKIKFENAIQESAMSFRASASDEQKRAALVQLCTETLKSLKTNDTPFKACMTR